MATTRANLMQTAVNAAATMVGAFAQAGLVTDVDAAKAEFDAIRTQVFELLVEQPNEEPKATGGGGGFRSAGGGRKGGKTFTAEEARNIELIFGKFKGVTLGQLETMTAEECAEYGYGEGDKTGLQYLKYLANNQDPKGSFIRKAAEAILEARRAEAA